MDVKMKTILLFCIAFCANIALSLSSDVVPVLLWGSKGVEDLSKPSAGQSLSKQRFTDDILSKLHQDLKENVVVFLQKKLSLDDITQNADAYNQNSNGGHLHNLKNLMSSQPSMHLPRVASPMDAIKSWGEKFAGKVHDLTSPYSVEDLPLSEEGNNLIMVHLPETKSLEATDDVIHTVTSKMEASSQPYSAMFTGETSSKTPRQSMYLGRHLLAADDDPGKHFYNHSCFYFYADKITFQVATATEKNNTWVLERANKDESGCSPQPVLKLTFPANGDLTSLELTVTFTNTSTGYWEAKDWKVSYSTGSVTKTDVALKVGSIYAPFRDSYHCTKPKIQQRPNSTDKGDSGVASFMMENLQLQGFSIKNGKFGRVNDCVGFFTIPIWSGLISMLVLISILIFGILMLASIDTMDRFDDPKGKTISVNVAD